LARRYSTSLEACATECLATAGCGGFDWDTKDFDCQLESVNYAEAVDGGNWKTDANGDWVFYSLIKSTSSSSTSVSTTTVSTPEPCLKWCELVDLTYLGKDCSAKNNKKNQCKSSFVRTDADTHIKCKWVGIFGSIGMCMPNPDSTMVCPQATSFTGCRCTSVSGWSDRKCRRRCDVTAGGNYDSDCAAKCGATCPANEAVRRLFRLRGAAEELI